MPLPSDTIILFDGVCNLCSGAVQFILKHERSSVLRFASLQSEAGIKLLSQYNINPQETDSIVLIENNHAYIRSTAALKIAKYLNAPWRIVSWFGFVPPFMRDGLYEWIARNRYRFFGKKDECWLPSPELRARFL